LPKLAKTCQNLPKLAKTCRIKLVFVRCKKAGVCM
jgi:hypothetical protein